MTFGELASDWRNGADTLEAHTSGSTGRPKCIRLPRQFVEDSARRTNTFFGIGRNAVLYCPLSADYIAGKMMWVRAELAGARFIKEEPSNRPLHALSEETKRIDLLAVVPSQLQFIINSAALPEIRYIIVGGAPTDDDTRLRTREWSGRTGTKVYETYGMTETASHIALREISAPSPEPFRTLPGITVSAGPDYCLRIHIPGWPDTRTRDCARIISPTEFEILGRADGVIITGALKVHPEDVERRISSAVGCPLLISSEPDPKWGERVVLLVETGHEPLTDAEVQSLHEKLGRMLAPHERPRRIASVARLDRTESGKIKRIQKSMH